MHFSPKEISRLETEGEMEARDDTSKSSSLILVGIKVVELVSICLSLLPTDSILFTLFYFSVLLLFVLDLLMIPPTIHTIVSLYPRERLESHMRRLVPS